MGYRSAPDGWWQDFVESVPARTGKLAVTRCDGSPHVAPVWVGLDRGAGPDGEDQIVFMTGADTVKGRSILRDGRVSLCFDDEQPPFAFVTIAGTTTTSTDPDDLFDWGTRIAGRYMGADLAEQYGARNAVPPEMVVRVTPTGSPPRSTLRARTEASVDASDIGVSRTTIAFSGFGRLPMLLGSRAALR